MPQPVVVRGANGVMLLENAVLYLVLFERLADRFELVVLLSIEGDGHLDVSDRHLGDGTFVYDVENVHPRGFEDADDFFEFAGPVWYEGLDA